ncbi:copper resistance protein CopC [Actinoplanes sp. NPDC051494]|uniref:copper resistance protein CopC n=1 Tax=Actinoplanes sp. NPDC051494 TaxID=3363907 RepID=UPI0037BB4630
MKRVLLTLAAIAAIILPGTPAWAHNQLLESSPAKDATVKKAPTEISLKFMQKLNPEFTTIVVTDGNKAKVAAADPEIDGPTGVLPLTGALANGTYTVAYRVVSVDGHTVQGSYTFTLAGPVATSAAPSAVPSSAAPAPPSVVPSSDAPSSGEPVLVDAAPTGDDGVPAGLLIGIGVALLAVLAIGGVIYGRRRAGASAG